MNKIENPKVYWCSQDPLCKVKWLHGISKTGIIQLFTKCDYHDDFIYRRWEFNQPLA